jgi:hypothetical protein
VSHGAAALAPQALESEATACTERANAWTGSHVSDRRPAEVAGCPTPCSLPAEGGSSTGYRSVYVGRW